MVPGDTSKLSPNPNHDLPVRAAPGADCLVETAPGEYHPGDDENTFTHRPHINSQADQQAMKIISMYVRRLVLLVCLVLASLLLSQAKSHPKALSVVMVYLSAFLVIYLGTIRVKSEAYVGNVLGVGWTVWIVSSFVYYLSDLEISSPDGDWLMLLANIATLFITLLYIVPQCMGGKHKTVTCAAVLVSQPTLTIMLVVYYAVGILPMGYNNLMREDVALTVYRTTLAATLHVLAVYVDVAGSARPRGGSVYYAGHVVVLSTQYPFFVHPAFLIIGIAHIAVLVKQSLPHATPCLKVMFLEGGWASGQFWDQVDKGEFPSSSTTDGDVPLEQLHEPLVVDDDDASGV